MGSLGSGYLPADCFVVPPTDDVINESIDYNEVTLVRAFGSYHSNQIRAKGSHQHIDTYYRYFNLCVWLDQKLGLAKTVIYGLFCDTLFKINLERSSLSINTSSLRMEHSGMKQSLRVNYSK